MKYLNEKSQFTTVSDELANQIMESMGYDIPEIEVTNSTVSNVYQHGDEQFILTEEVVEGDDDKLYVRLERVTELTVINVDENGRNNLVESINFEDLDYVLEGVFEDDEGMLYATLVNEEANEEE